MEAVWSLEDKWKLSTKQALLLLLFSASGVLGLCVAMTAMLLRRLKSRKTTPPRKQHLIIDSGEDWPPPEDPACGWVAIKRVLMSSLRWSRASKWRPGESSAMMSTSAGSSWSRETPLPLLMEKEMMIRPDFDDYDSESPVWQRPILMGEKCELPRFSGLILYDENGHLLCDVARKGSSHKITTNQRQSKISSIGSRAQVHQALRLTAAPTGKEST
ncbi:hypothetical protein L484_017505 [Morus notabilis]|uniref:Uncharacterized protein n=1 Tax=Morus notabilis TaxID=981085 RepID=W9QTX3_9ROSA|nr:hypothetical protein L484_017505 [Morus notabilis]